MSVKRFDVMAVPMVNCNPVFHHSDPRPLWQGGGGVRVRGGKGLHVAPFKSGNHGHVLLSCHPLDFDHSVIYISLAPFPFYIPCPYINNSICRVCQCSCDVPLVVNSTDHVL